jgi:hypothetical protein
VRKLNELQNKTVYTEKELIENKQNETNLLKELNQTKQITDNLKKIIDHKEVLFKNELNESKILKERQEIVNNRLN